MGLIRRIVAQAPLRALPVLGWYGEHAWRRLVSRADIVPGASPHHSELLVLAGEIPEEWKGRLLQLFETLSLPRLALRIGPAGDADFLPGELAVEPDGVDTEALRQRLHDLGGPQNRPVLPEEPPAPWRGVGPHGQGGGGMMGGKPYGRPMAMTADDPDKLALGEVPMALGPFFPGLPSGMLLEVQMQGDRVRAVNHVRSGFPTTAIAERPDLTKDADWGPVARVALGQGVPLAEIEGARIDTHLSWAADLLSRAGLTAVASRLRAAAAGGERQRDALERLWRSAERWGGAPALQRPWRGPGDERAGPGPSRPPRAGQRAGRDSRADDATYTRRRAGRSAAKRACNPRG